MIVHAGLLAAWMDGAWRGALIEGPSGAGKSDLALRALQWGFRLVADDRTLIWSSGGRLFGRAPHTLKDLLEVRGLDVVREPALTFCEIRLIVRCEETDRIPELRTAAYAGLSLPLVGLNPLEASAPAKLSRALQHLGCGAEGAYQARLVAPFLPRAGGESR